MNRRRFALAVLLVTNAMLHPLDDMIWEALTGPHAALALSAGAAVRYPDGMPPFAALKGPRKQAFEDLSSLLEPGGMVAIALSPTEKLGAGWVARAEIRLVQMVCEQPVGAPESDPIALTASDVPEMLALVEATQPGPFGPRSIELGRYVGYRDERGVLVAMAGERLRPSGFTEVSAVCTHPEHRRKGLAEAAVRDVASLVQARGEVPMLHVEDGEKTAGLIDFYARLGFRERRKLVLTILQRSPPDE